MGSAALGAVPADNVAANLAHIGSRVYSEEGIAMFLACENLAAVETVPPNKVPVPSPLNQKVASAFQRYAQEWQHAHPDAPASDVAKILEFIADRDFASGGQEPSL
jgi:hypothetical protein